LENLGYLFAVFAIVWLVIFAYVLILSNNQKRLAKEMHSLKEILKEKFPEDKDAELSK